MSRMIKSLVLVCCLALAGVAQADFSDNFDSYLTGTLAPQGGWKGWDNNPAAAIAVVTNNVAYSSPNSIMVSRADDLVHEYSGATSGQWEFSLQQYIPSTSTGTTFIIMMNDYTDGGPYDWAVQINFEMDTSTVKSTLYGGDATLPMVKDQWVPIKMTIDLGANTVTEYYNGTVLTNHVWTTGTPMGVAASDFYANAYTDVGADPVYYDNVQLKAIPEPGSLALLGLFGGAALLWRRIRRQR